MIGKWEAAGVVALVAICIATGYYSIKSQPKNQKQELLDRAKIEASGNYEESERSKHWERVAKLGTFPDDVKHVWLRVPYSQTIDEILFYEAEQGTIKLPEGVRLSDKGKVQVRFGLPGGEFTWRDVDRTASFAMMLYNSEQAYYEGDGIYYLRDDVFRIVAHQRPQFHRGALLKNSNDKRLIWDAVTRCYRSPYTLAKLSGEEHQGFPINPTSQDIDAAGGFKIVEELIKQHKEESKKAKPKQPKEPEEAGFLVPQMNNPGKFGGRATVVASPYPLVRYNGVGFAYSSFDVIPNTVGVSEYTRAQQLRYNRMKIQQEQNKSFPAILQAICGGK